MVAERRERKAAPSTWIAPEPVGKGKVVKRKAPVKKKAAAAAVAKPPSKFALAAAAAAAGVVSPSAAAAAAPVVVPATSTIEPSEEDSLAFGNHEENGENEDGNTRSYMGIDEPVAATSVSGDGLEAAAGDPSLFCVCMGQDDGQPMIMCEACENWFHFECINLSEEDASRIATYYCDACEQAGSGKTEWSYDAPNTFDDLPSIPLEAPQSSPALPSRPLSPPASFNEQQPQADSSSTIPQIPLPLPPMPHPLTPSDSGDEPDNGDDGDYFATVQGAERSNNTKGKGRLSDDNEADDHDHDHEEEDDDEEAEAEDTYDERGISIKRKKKAGTAASTAASRKGHQRRKSSSAGTSSAAKRRRRVVEDEEEAAERRSKASASTDKFYSKSNVPNKTSKESNPLLNPTRKHCIEQLEKILQSIFDSASAPLATVTGESESVEAVVTPPSTLNARMLAESIEKELFEQLSELDAKGVRTHSKKYIAKFRTLHFNLKSNSYFRSRVASGALDAAAIVAMHQEDLLSPEVRAEQEAEKARSLAQSVKEAAVQPKTKMTHKGEEILDEVDQHGPRAVASHGSSTTPQAEVPSRSESLVQAEESFEAFSARDLSMSITAASPRTESAPRFGSPPAMSPVISQSPIGPYSPIIPNRRDSTNFAVDQISPADSPDKTTPAVNGEDTPALEAEEVFRPPLPHHSRSDSTSKIKLDLDAVWSNLKPTPVASPEKEATPEPEAEVKEKEEDDMDVESSGDEQEKKAEIDTVAKDDAALQKEDYDPFASEGREKASADDEFDLLMGGDVPSAPEKMEAELAGKTIDSSSSSPKAASGTSLDSLPIVWEGRIGGLDEGDFPVRMVQVAGTPFGPHPAIWDRLLPKGKIEIKGRIGQAQASKYIMDSYFSPSREIIVLAMLSIQNKAMEGGEKPTTDSYSHTLETYAKNGRYGAAPPPGEVAKIGKDCYIVPLKKADPLPDFVVVQESSILPDTGNRQQDYLLAVLVIRKGLGLDGSRRTGSGGNTPLTQQASQEKVKITPAPASSGQLSPATQSGMQPPSVQAQQPQVPFAPGAIDVPGLDPNALQSLLSNPSLLQALGATVPGASPLPNTAPPYGNFSPPQPLPGQGNQYNGLAMPGVAPGQPQLSPPWAGGAPQPYPPQQQYGHPQQQSWNPAGSPPWQGQGQPQNHHQRPQQAGWGAPPPPGYIPPPGLGGAYIDPERIKAASAEARAIGERERQERERRGGSGSDHRNANRNGGNQHGGGGNRGNWQDRDRHDQKGFNRRGGNSSNNQMNAGIQDRGWGSRR